jgi:hypothetical protein
MPTNTYVALQTQVLASPAASVTFTGISQAYTDLILVVGVPSGHNSGSGIQFNSDTDYSNNYSRTVLTGNGSSASSFRNNGSSNPAANHDLGALRPNGNLIVNIQNYSNSTTFKTVLSRGGGAANDVNAVVTLWKGTAAITSFVFTTDGGNLSAGMTFTIYGIASADNFAKATGGMLYEDSTYWYHVFASNGTFTPKQALTCDYLVVAGGGGGGGSANAGGGGAGGLRSTVTATGGGGALESALSVTSGTAYAITVGAGGAAGTGNYPSASKGTSGGNSIFSTITSTGGGGGAPNDDNTTDTSGVTGGSGGGSASTGGTGGGTPGNGTTNQGYRGGYGYYDGGSARHAGGGGGAGSIGGGLNTGTSGNGGNGGAGVTISALATPTGTGVSGAYAGGGAGKGDTTNGTASAGGGAVATAGAAYTGGGGGGGVGANGGSGLVIIRYAK